MSCVSPDGPVYQAGTLSGNPVAMAAGIAALEQCAEPGFYEDQEERTNYMVDKINAYANEKGYAFEIFSIGSIFWIAFSDKVVIRRADEIDSDMTPFKILHSALLNRGIYVGPSGYEVGFVSKAHTKEVLDSAIPAFCDALDEVFSQLNS
jgi:glutamate-1-semialdehyde 2,1-aminomutase